MPKPASADTAEEGKVLDYIGNNSIKEQVRQQRHRQRTQDLLQQVPQDLLVEMLKILQGELHIRDGSSRSIPMILGQLGRYLRTVIEKIS